MLADLGVTPVSVSKQHAASVFDDALSNGQAGAKPPFARKRQERKKESRAIPVAGVEFCSRKCWGDRLCWSSFLEAMVSAS